MSSSAGLDRVSADSADTLDTDVSQYCSPFPLGVLRDNQSLDLSVAIHHHTQTEREMG